MPKATLSTSKATPNETMDANDCTAVLIATAKFANSVPTIDANHDGKKSPSEIVGFLIGNVNNGVVIFNGLAPAIKWWRKQATFTEKLACVKAFETEFDIPQKDAEEAVEASVSAAVSIERAVIAIGKAVKKQEVEPTTETV